MPMLKTITAHTSCRNIQHYLEKKNRALAHDFVNLSEGDWWQEMDQTRVAFGHNSPTPHGKPVTYRHYIISPDPDDQGSLEDLRSLCQQWAEDNFPGGQCAIVYHDDNEDGILHGHVVVNATDLSTGCKHHIDKVRVAKLAASLQDIGIREGFSELDDLEVGVKKQSKQSRYKTMAERQIEKKGRLVFKSEIEKAIDAAIDSTTRKSGGWDAFSKELENAAGVRVKMTKRGVTFIHPGNENWKAQGSSIGGAYTIEGIAERLEFGRSIQTNLPPISPLERYISKIERVGERASWCDLNNLALTLRVIRDEGITSLNGFHEKEISLGTEAGTLKTAIGEGQKEVRSLSLLAEKAGVITKYSPLESEAEGLRGSKKKEFESKHAGELRSLKDLRQELSEKGFKGEDVGRVGDFYVAKKQAVDQLDTDFQGLNKRISGIKKAGSVAARLEVEAGRIPEKRPELPSVYPQRKKAQPLPRTSVILTPRHQERRKSYSGADARQRAAASTQARRARSSAEARRQREQAVRNKKRRDQGR